MYNTDLDTTWSCGGSQKILSWNSAKEFRKMTMKWTFFCIFLRQCVVSLSKNINPSLVLVQPRKTRPFITERLLMGRKESNQTNKQSILMDPKHRIIKGIHCSSL